MHRLLRLSAVACVGLIAACAPQDPLATDEVRAMRQVNTLIPKGTSETRAMKTLSERGFQLTRPSGDHAANHLVIGSYARGDFYWQLGLVIVDARVAATTVKVTDLRPLAR